MKPVMQTKFTTPDHSVHGNCFAACVASLLELPLSDMPAFENAGNGKWFDLLWELLQAHGYDCGGTYYPKGDPDWWIELLTRCPAGVDGYYIVGGDSPRTYVARGHACIYYNGKLAHDPHPSGEGLLSIEEVYMIERKSTTEH